MAKVTTFCLMLALSRVLKLKIYQLDVDSAFLYADLDEDVYMTPPPGMNIKSGYCLKLDKSLYGLNMRNTPGISLDSAMFRRILGWFSSLYATSVYARGRNPASNFKESKKINPFSYH